MLDGRLNCPPEDCGGVWGYKNILELLKDPSKDKDGILEWVGNYNPNKFSLDEINAELANYFEPKPKKKAAKKTSKKKVKKMWVFTGNTENGK
ncbi:hypothetical protein FACS189443_1840 [Planctomycetales bacterium]|nr:hypothetical protein FACS189443_1840 [Planctomycetales bacterium]